MGCEKHKRYEAKRKPRTNCDHCWSWWFYVEVKRAQATILPNTMTERCLFKAVRNHRHTSEKYLENKNDS